MDDEIEKAWQKVLGNAGQLVFSGWDLAFPEDKECEKITKEVDEKYCSCDNRQEVKIEIAREVVYVCKRSFGGCGKEVKL